MHISKKVLNIALMLVLLTGLGGGAYFAYLNHEAARALEENIEHQVLTAIEAKYPEIYIVAVVFARDEHALVYYILPDEEPYEGYAEQLLTDAVTILVHAYPHATSYSFLPTRITTVDTFEGQAHVGVARQGLLFTRYAAEVMVDSECPECDLGELFAAGELVPYSAQTFGLHLISEPTARERGHIPPWEAVEE